MQNEERINGLETQVRTLKRIVYGFGCLFVAGLVVGATTLQTVPDVIQPKHFEVVNDDGKKVAVLFAGKNGGELGIRNKEGKQVVALGADEDGGGLNIFNRDGKPVVGLGADEDGGLLGISNRDGKPVVGIYADEDGGLLGISNKDGKQVAGIYADAEGAGRFKTSNAKGETTSHTP